MSYYIFKNIKGRKKVVNGQGFTIIELMVATVVFSVTLLVLTQGILQIGHIYYKGVTSSRTQEAARSIADDVTQAIQFYGGTILPSGSSSMKNGEVEGACIGSRRYSYIPGKQITDTEHRFVGDIASGGCAVGTKARSIDEMKTGLPGTSGTSPQEFLGDKMRIADFDVTPIAGSEDLYNVKIRVAFGDDDLLCSPTGNTNECSDSSVANSPNKPDVVCRSVAGSQFCSISEVNTTVQRRLKGSPS
jgi:prepilin-type N-terminal cleavage/methylation domain-containing protein